MKIDNRIWYIVAAILVATATYGHFQAPPEGIVTAAPSIPTWLLGGGGLLAGLMGLIGKKGDGQGQGGQFDLAKIVDLFKLLDQKNSPTPGPSPIPDGQLDLAKLMGLIQLWLGKGGSGTINLGGKEVDLQLLQQRISNMMSASELSAFVKEHGTPTTITFVAADGATISSAFIITSPKPTIPTTLA